MSESRQDDLVYRDCFDCKAKDQPVWMHMTYTYMGPSDRQEAYYMGTSPGNFKRYDWTPRCETCREMWMIRMGMNAIVLGE